YRDQSETPGSPEAVVVVTTELMTHGLHDVRPCHRPRMGEALLEQPYTKEMIAMAVGRVNRSQVLAARHDPVRQGLRGFGGKEGVDQHGIPLAVDQRGRIGYPG